MRYYLFLFLINFCFNQGWYNHPELDWETIETDHFLIHFHKETSRSAREAAAVAEKIYDPITSFYKFEPDSKTHIIIQDTDDISNGAAYYYDNKIIIWALPLDFDLRGSHRWLNNVITHEFVHIVQIGASMKYSRRFPASFLQFMNYEVEKREDVLYGYPNILISYPLPGVSVPPWLAEGTAQFMYPDANFDFWDSHRDMIVRDRILNNNLLSFNAMNSFGKRGIGNESIYNQGFLFSIWLSENYGNDILYKISKSLSKPFNYSINQSIKDVTGKSGQNLYNEWQEYLKLYYKGLVKNIDKYEKKGKILLSEGTSNIHPVWAPNDKKFVYLSNKENDGFGQTDLFSYSFIDSTSKKITAGVKTAPTWVNDSTLVYTKRSKPNKWGSKYFDLYKYLINEEKEQRITYNARLISPIYNEKTNNIAAISSYDGTSNILISEDFNIDDDTLNFNQITNYNNGIQLLSLSWHESKLLVDGVDHQGRKIFYVNQDNGTLEPIKNDYEKFENRDQHTAYLSGLVYTTDQSGINNLILNNGTTSNYITNVYGGAFMPCVSKGGKILYSLYENGKYNIAILDNWDKVDISNVGYSQNYFLNHNISELILDGEYNSKPYEDKMLSMSIFPKIMIDYNTLKPGLYFMGNEVIDRFSMFGGASTNALSDIDIFLIMEYKKYLPTFYTNLFWISRHKNADRNNPYLYPRVNGDSVDNIEIFNDLSFSLFSGEIGTRFALGLHKFKMQYGYSNYRQHVKQNVYQKFTYNETDSLIWNYGEIGFDYYRGHNLSLIYELNIKKPSYAKNMIPRNGWGIKGNLSYEWNQFMDGFAISEEYSTFGANFVPNNTARITFEAEKHFIVNDVNNIVGSFISKGGALSKPQIDDFFHFFGGGMPGIKGYTFYEESLTGPFYFIGTSAIRMPLFLEQNYVFGQFNMQNLSIGGIFQFGNAFNNSLSDVFDFGNYKLSAGLECRLLGFSFFSYPSAFAYEYHKPLYDIKNEGKHYFTLLFDY